MREANATNKRRERGVQKNKLIRKSFGFRLQRGMEREEARGRWRAPAAVLELIDIVGRGGKGLDLGKSAGGGIQL